MSRLGVPVARALALRGKRIAEGLNTKRFPGVKDQQNDFWFPQIASES